MMSLDIRTGASVALLLSFGALTLAQDAGPTNSAAPKGPHGDSRIEVGIAFAETLSTSSFDASLKLREYAEDGTFSGAYTVKKAPGAGFDLQYNLGAKFGVRIGAQTFSRKSDATFSAQVPHPFFFSKPRSLSGSQSGLGFNEKAFTIAAVYRGGSGKWKLNLEGGPAFFAISATLADRINYGDVYPYDSITFSGVSASKKKVSPVGFAVGLEIGRQLSDAVSAVVQGRFTGGSGNIDLNGAKVSVKAGGAQVRVGLRLTLARRNQERSRP